LLAAQKPLVSQALCSGQDGAVNVSGAQSLADLGHCGFHRSQKGRPGILQEMPAVSDLDCIGQGPRDGLAISAVPVPGDDLDLGIAAQPGLDGRRSAVREQVEMADKPLQSGGPSAMRPGHRGWKAFGETAPAATLRRAAEATDHQHDPHLATMGRQVGQAPAIAAVLPPGELPAPRTAGRGGHGAGLHNYDVPRKLDAIRPQSPGRQTLPCHPVDRRPPLASFRKK
jgi:hypothetical protein